jgi:hypothetical protein
VAFSTRKFCTSIAPRRCMLACWTFACMLILIPSMVRPNLEPAWWTVHWLGNSPTPANFAYQLYNNATCWHAENLLLCSP